jgi:hypothetical protein
MAPVSQRPSPAPSGVSRAFIEKRAGADGAGDTARTPDLAPSLAMAPEPPSDHRSACPFCPPPADRTFLDGRLVVGFWDRYPVSPGHALLVPRRHVASWFDATPEEQHALTDAIAIAKSAIEAT